MSAAVRASLSHAIMVASLWGPAYRGLGGYFRKMGEIAVTPANFPFMIGGVSAFILLASIPVTDKDIKESKFTNRDEIMEEKKRRTGSYH